MCSMGTVLPEGVTIRQVTERCALEAGWKKTEDGWKRPEAPKSKEDYIKSGWGGLACGYKNVGFSFGGAPENCGGATIILEGNTEIEVAKLYHAGAEVGQGAHTVLAQMAADALGLPFSKIQTFYSDTATALNSGSVSASRMTYMAGNSIIGAAKIALENGTRAIVPRWAHSFIDLKKNDSYGSGRWTLLPKFHLWICGTSFLVDVDTRSGEVSIRKAISVDDVGKAINPQLVVGQIEGAVVQATGYTLLEDWKKKDARVKTDRFSTYLIPTVKDIPDEMISVVMEEADPTGPYGARGVGEMPYLPVAPGIIEAVYQATGVRFHHFPLTAENVLRGGLGKLPAKEWDFWEFE